MPHPIKKLERIKPKGRTYKLFEMYEWEVEFDEDYFHLSSLKEIDYHNAYDADENGTLFRADAIFKHGDEMCEVPVFASKTSKDGVWKWSIRFRPHLTGRWEFLMFVLRWHNNKLPGDNEDNEKVTDYEGVKKTPYYQHLFFGPAPLKPSHIFYVHDKPPRLPGPLEVPNDDKKDNPYYFYRSYDVNGKRQRKPFFLLGFARPWVTKSKIWDSFLDRKTELFQPMLEKGCNVLYHWMSPNETQLVHQANCEFWFNDTKNEFDGFERRTRSYVPWPGKKLTGSDKALGYRQYDQGRALHTDNIFDQARLEKNKGILLVWAVMPHSLLQDEWHEWPECRWAEPTDRENKKEGVKVKYEPVQSNGFHLFEKFPGQNISIREFFEMNPTSSTPWKRQLWKHFANYWRYIIGRWTAHPSLGVWVLMDELEGVGDDTRWWWYNEDVTYEWHNNLVRMIRGEMNWGEVGLKTLKYTGDYLKHPLSTSTTHYEGSYTDRYVKELLQYLRKKLKKTKNATQINSLKKKIDELDKKKQLLDDFHKEGLGKKALQLLDSLKDLPHRGDWWKSPNCSSKDCHLDFLSHHAYQAVPTSGLWVTEKKTGQRKYIDSQLYKQNKAKYIVFRKSKGRKTQKELQELLDRCLKSDIDLRLTNQECSFRIAPDRWLWDSLCMRLRNWSRHLVDKKIVKPHLITEYGCWERDDPNPFQNWDHYGKRVLSFTHYANWAALSLGHAGIPFKWNTGSKFGEMAARKSDGKTSKVWNSKDYPIDNYGEITNLANFIAPGVLLPEVSKISINELRQQEDLEIVGIKDGRDFLDKNFNAWALIDESRTMLIAWIYDRTFTTNGKPVKRWLKIKLKPNKTYTYVWYDTWNGRFIKPAAIFSGDLFTVRSDKDGIVEIPLEEVPFPKKKRMNSKETVTWVSDGNDIAIKLTLSEPS